MTITPEEKVWTVVQAIADAYEMAPTNGKVLIQEAQFKGKVSEIELEQILNKLEQDHQVIKIERKPSHLDLGLPDDCYDLRVPDRKKFREFLNQAHSQHYGDINKLAAENFFAVSEVTMDICAALQLVEGVDVRIQLMPDVIRFPALFPGDGINMRDRYCDFRWKALMYLRDRKHIESFDLDNDPYEHRWGRKVDVVVDRYDFDKFYKKLSDAYERRVVEPAKKNAAKTPKAPKMAPSPSVQQVAIISMPQVDVKNVEETIIIKGKKKINLPRFDSTPWSQASIQFLDGRNVMVTAGKKQTPADFASLGFANEKNGKPNTAWAFLLELANNGGETPQLDLPIPDAVKQHKMRLSSFLKQLFRNETEPFEDSTSTRTYKLKISLIPPQTEDVGADNLGVSEYLEETMASKYEPEEPTR